MRMWLVTPKVLCRKHLLCEHADLHMLAKYLKDDRCLNNYIENGMIHTKQILDRHNDLKYAMLDRDYNHDSPLVMSPDTLVQSIRLGLECYINKLNSFKILHNRCEECKKRIDRYWQHYTGLTFDNDTEKNKRYFYLTDSLCSL